ncbi:MAG TPA: DUF3093 domain-containing protein [Nocardioidaceae bacterium]|nr:DUF3093 domain-containing protein [Nocardioidaceae bacterium]
MTTSTSYDERLGVPLRWWALATMFFASVLLAFLVALPAGVAFGTVGLMVAGVIALFVGYGAAEVAVRDGELVAGQARIPVGFLAAPTPLDSGATKLALGRDADARAYLLVRPYLKRSVKVSIVDPADPTPYWLISTRHPRTLAAALAEAIAAAPPQQQR